MKALAPRIEKLYASEAERWRAAWKQFDDTLWSHLTRDEVQAYFALYAPDCKEEQVESVNRAVACLVKEIKTQLGKEPSTPEEKKRSAAFIDAFLDLAGTAYGDVVDLSRSPEDVPFPPDDDVEQAEREEAALLQLARDEKKKGEIERMAAALVSFHVAICRTARVYSREKP